MVEEQYNEFVETTSQNFSKLLIDRCNGVLADIAQLDQPIQQILRRIGAKTMETVVNHVAARLSAEVTAQGIPTLRSHRVTYDVLFGPISVSSPYHYNRATRASARPTLDSMGIAGGKRSNAVQRALCDFGAEESFAQATKRFEEHYGWSPPESATRDITEQIAEEAETYVKEQYEQATEGTKERRDFHRCVDALLVELDGCDIRTGILVQAEGEEKTEKRGLPKKKRITEWKEVRVGFVRWLGEVHKNYVAQQAEYPDVVNQLVQASQMKGMTENTQVVGVADGAIGLREEMESQFLGMQFILDRPHLEGHFYETAEALGFQGENKKSWVSEKMAQIDAGEVLKVLRLLKEQNQMEPNERLTKLIKHVSRFADAVNYEEYKQKGYPIGSGEVESAHRYIPQKRLKLPGAWWHPDNINSMLALRVLRANEWWDDFWREKCQKVAA